MNKYSLIIFIIISFTIHCFASYFSVGFYSQDEHFQILSPVEYLLGINENFKNEIWEFSDQYQIRPWFQSYVYFYIIKFFKLFYIENPFVWTFLLRIISSLFAFSSLIFFYINFKDVFFKDNNFNRILILFFFFYPFFHARTSSENIGTSFFIFGLVFFYIFINKKISDKNIYNEIICGLLFGLAIISRYQLLIFVIGIYLWVFIFHLNIKNIQSLFVIGISIILMLILGIYCDSLGYGSFNFTYYNYFYSNFIGGMLNFFGTEPWWYYLYHTTLDFGPPIGLIFLIAFTSLLFKKFNNIIIFISLFYFFIFTLIGHKELRFLFPLFFFVPFIICAYLDDLKNNIILKLLKYIIIVFNFIFILILLYIPATEQVRIYEYIYNNKINNNIFYIEDNPYIISGLNPKLYTSYLPEIKKFNSNKLDSERYYLVLRDYNKFQALLKDSKCIKEYSVYPEIINKNPNWRKHKINWYVVFCKI